MWGIDRKGRLFGLFNLIDFAALCVVIGIVAMAINFFFLAPEKTGEISQITVLAGDIGPATADSIVIGDRLYNTKYMKTAPIATILKIESKNPAESVVADMNGNLVLRRSPVNIDVRFEIKFDRPVEVWPTKMLFHHHPFSIRLGDEFTVVNQKYSLSVKVVNNGFGSEKP